jgi:hypothetical protein
MFQPTDITFMFLAKWWPTDWLLAKCRRVKYCTACSFVWRKKGLWNNRGCHLYQPAWSSFRSVCSRWRTAWLHLDVLTGTNRSVRLPGLRCRRRPVSRSLAKPGDNGIKCKISSRVSIHITSFSTYLTNWLNKLECLLLASLSSVI